MASENSCSCAAGGIAHAAINDDLPSAETLRQLSKDDICVYDRENNTFPFKSLYSSPNATPRVLLIFVRHFYCPVWGLPYLLLPMSVSLMPLQVLTNY